MADTTRGASHASQAEEGAGWSVVVVGPGLLRAHAVRGDEVVVGRDAACDLVLDHARVSRRHLRLRIGRPCTACDLGSRNGTAGADGVLPAGVDHPIAPGQPLRVGPFTLILVAEAAADGQPLPSAIRVDDPTAATPPAVLVTLARSPLSVLIRGETGVGKELLAESIHRLSERRGALVRLNCATFSPELLASELFGHERGAFTGAATAKPGLLEAAAGGTVFLDEIGELPEPLQAKLLRAVEGHEVMRVGGVQPISVDVRFVVATNRDLHQEIARGAFRLDLYYRLAGVTLWVPPLRERGGALLELAHRLLEAAAARAGQSAPALTPAAVARLQAHDWPGNVRELRNVVERALLLCGGGDIGPQHILIDAPLPAAAPAPPSPAAPGPSAGAPAQDDEEEAERRRITEALAACAGNQTRAAQLLGISRATLATRLAVLRIPRPRRR